MIEEFVQGTLHSHSAFIHDQKIACDFFVDEYCTIYPYQVNCSHYPSQLTDKIRNGMREEMTRLVKLLKLKDGLMHTQFISNGDKFWIIETMRRCPGDLYGQFVGLSSSIPYVDYFARPFVGKTVPVTAECANPKFMGRHTISRMQPHIVSSFSHTIPAQNVRVIPLKSSGELMGPAPHDKLAILFAEFSTRAEMLTVSPRLDTYITIHSLDSTGHD